MMSDLITTSRGICHSALINTEMANSEGRPLLDKMVSYYRKLRQHLIIAHNRWLQMVHLSETAKH